jgi:molecular chaperone GrpE
VTQHPEQNPQPEGDLPPAAGEPGVGPVPESGVSPEPGAQAGEPEVGGGGPADASEVLEGEVVEPSTSEAAEADALLAEALDADAIEAQFSAAEADLAAAAATGEAGAVADQVAALTADLQRVHAEYSNYRKRVERDRELVRERAVETALLELLPILDDIGRAREHDELVGGFKSVGEALEAAVLRLGLSPFGAIGEPFDPTRHEALMREEQEGVTEPTVARVLQVGFEMNGRIVRPARVSVAGTD